MNLEYVITYRDYKEAHRVFMLRPKPYAAMCIFGVWVFPVIGTLIAILLTLNFFFHKISFHQSAVWILGIIAWVGIVFAVDLPFYLRRRYKRMLNGRKETDPVQFLIQDGQIISRIPGRSEGRFFPSAILDIVEGKSIVLVLAAKNLYFFIPRKELGEAGLQELRAWWQGGKSNPC